MYVQAWNLYKMIYQKLIRVISFSASLTVPKYITSGKLPTN